MLIRIFYHELKRRKHMKMEYRNTEYRSMGYPPVYVINLQSSKERKRNIEIQFKQQEIPYYLVPAVDGTRLGTGVVDSYDEIKQEYTCLQKGEKLAYFRYFNVPCNNDKYNIKKAFLSRPLVPGEIGCYLSHLKVYAHIIQCGFPMAVILEDDVQLLPDFGDLILELATHQLEHQIVFLGDLYFGVRSFVDEGSPMSLWGRIRIKPRYELGNYVALPLGSHAYLVTLAGACKLMDIALPIRMPLDLLLTLGIYDKSFKVAGMNPRAVRIVRRFFENTTITGRTIEDDRAAWKDILEDRLPVVYFVLRKIYRFLLPLSLLLRQMGRGYVS